MSQQNITLIKFGHFENNFLDKVVDDVTYEFRIPVKVKDGHIDLSEYYDPSRRQYNGNKLLKEVDKLYSYDSLKTIGLFNIDLFIPILTYIFGQAVLKGNTGIVSLYRLTNERYGMNMDDNLLKERITKEVIHELGHSFGLIHCHTSNCVMRSSTYVEDIDQKNSSLCHKCRSELEFKP